MLTPFQAPRVRPRRHRLRMCACDPRTRNSDPTAEPLVVLAAHQEFTGGPGNGAGWGTCWPCGEERRVAGLVMRQVAGQLVRRSPR